MFGKNEMAGISIIFIAGITVCCVEPGNSFHYQKNDNNNDKYIKNFIPIQVFKFFRKLNLKSEINKVI
jgi:hypothetical protein